MLVEPCVAPFHWIDGLPTPLLPHDAAIDAVPQRTGRLQRHRAKGQEAPHRIENALRILRRESEPSVRSTYPGVKT